MTDSAPNVIPIYTIGYGARSIDDFLAVLHAHEIAYLLDVRSAPFSRYKPEFGKDALETRLRSAGIRYLYLGDLLGGQPADRDCYLDEKVVYERVREKVFFQEGIERVRRAFEKQVRVALMCSEGKPAGCHRVKLIGVEFERLGIPVVHIDEQGRLRTQAEVIGELTECQLSLFGEPEFRSRKKYREKGAPANEREDEDEQT